MTFWVPGKPRATQTGTVVRAGTRLIPIRRNTEWTAYFRKVAQEHAPPAPLEGAVVLRFVFHLPRPMSGKAAKRRWPTVRPDGENLGKGLVDTLEGLFIHDDAQSVKTTFEKCYAEGGRVGVEVVVEALE